MSLVIGGIGIANVMVISVTERTREIGTRLAIGARRRDVLTQFLIEAALLSGVGGVAGVAISWAIGFLLSVAAPAFPSVPPMWAVFGGLGSAISTGLVAGYLPARRAAALDPVEALRYESARRARPPPANHEKKALPGAPAEPRTSDSAPAVSGTGLRRWWPR